MIMITITIMIMIVMVITVIIISIGWVFFSTLSLPNKVWTVFPQPSLDLMPLERSNGSVVIRPHGMDVVVCMAKISSTF